MNKLLKIAIVAIFAVALFFAGYFFIYLPHYYDIRIGISTPVESDGKYLEDFIISYDHMPENKIYMVEELTKAKNDFRTDFYNEHKEDNYHIEIDIKVENSKTIVTYTGTITNSKTNATEPFEKEIVHDFILTKNVQY